jgi:2-amino-4-hydroxy-6-hydroxymethyldihydropteridine diphosphokinase
MNRIYLGIGTNLGKREDNLKSAVEKIENIIGPVIQSSTVYETEPWGFRSEMEFLNLVIEVETKLNPSGLLGRLLMIESQMGRIRESGKYSSRIIDIDILFYGKLIIEKKALTLPHPMMQERRFVLIPLCEIAPDFIHPVLKKDIKKILEECKDKGKVIKYIY